MNLEDTIAAISTAMGPAGIGIIRVSGRRALASLRPIFKPAKAALSVDQLESHKMVLGWIMEERRFLDEVLLVTMRAPHSYTTEDMVEIHCHGSVLILQSILKLILKQGVRLAQPGEFTQRAFLHGRLDLTQVEAVSDLIHARSRLGMQVAVNQIRGKLFQTIQRLKEEMADVLALLNASIDFSEEDEEFTHQEDCLKRLRHIRLELEQLLTSADQGKIMRDGIGVALIGRPNVGKSSLLNALLKEQRAIVTDIPGTTRDILEENLQMEGLAIRLMDTAGIRETTNPVEIEGVQRSRDAWALAEMVLLVLDASEDLSKEDLALIHRANCEKTLVILNKADLLQGKQPEWMSQVQAFESLLISTRSANDIKALEHLIFRRSLKAEVVSEEQVMITNLRQQQAVQKALHSIQFALEGLELNTGEECVAVDLKNGLSAVGEVVGETTAEDLLNRIFSEFCIGK
ncbi:tRNA uridine-5-carboxymethylaminomethyl(34) synthesis GTPase MnmE [Deltaproteobacteria bacterium TL4]